MGYWFSMESCDVFNCFRKVTSEKINIVGLFERKMLVKLKTIFVCSSCGYESPKWMGKCPSCNEWNTFYEEKDVTKSGTKEKKKERAEIVQLNKVEKKETLRIKTGIEELDRVLGGGFVKGSLTLLRW